MHTARAGNGQGSKGGRGGGGSRRIIWTQIRIRRRCPVGLDLRVGISAVVQLEYRLGPETIQYSDTVLEPTVYTHLEYRLREEAIGEGRVIAHVDEVVRPHQLARRVARRLVPRVLRPCDTSSPRHCPRKTKTTLHWSGAVVSSHADLCIRSAEANAGTTVSDAAERDCVSAAERLE